MPHPHPLQRGLRSEQVGSWYFRLNGFLSIPGFVVHPDQVREHPRTEADLIAARFPFSSEVIAGRPMVDDERLTRLVLPAKSLFTQRILFLLVEVKTNLCNVNGPWSNPRERNMQRVIRRLGFASPEEVDHIAMTMYEELRWEDERYVLQYVSLGRQRLRRKPAE